MQSTETDQHTKPTRKGGRFDNRAAQSVADRRAKMQNTDVDFETWFGVLQSNVLDRTGVNIKDEDAFRDDYDTGRDVFDVIEEMVAEYQD